MKKAGMKRRGEVNVRNGKRKSRIKRPKAEQEGGIEDWFDRESVF